jgi:2-keto-4-pentenoate hydratase/2-oxohepta-3-ene-1,7-dioic acid hydratase in catechol pathway
MLLITFVQGDRTGIGLLDREADEVVDLAAVAPDLPMDMPAFIALGSPGLEVARRALAGGDGRVPAAQVRVLAPMPRPPRNIFCLGKNYAAHADEVQSLPGGPAGGGAPAVPIVFTKATSSVTGPRAPIPSWLDLSHTTDYEGELAVVIGPGGRGIPRGEAMEHVYGYTIVNDVTARDLQRQHQQWFLGKSLDGFCPMGPVIVTVDDVPDVAQLRLQTRVNGRTAAWPISSSTSRV